MPGLEFEVLLFEPLFASVPTVAYTYKTSADLYTVFKTRNPSRL